MPKRLLFLALLLLSFNLKAEVAVFVHGYLGHAHSWERSGVTTALSNNSWRYQGILLPNYYSGLRILPKTHDLSPHSKLFYSVELPSLMALPVQAAFLQQALMFVRTQHPEENISLIGHSAGGVAARLALVRYGAGQVKRLITIASPHMGTFRAAQGLDFADNSGLFGIIKSFFGGDLYDLARDSRPLLYTLLPPRRGTLLYGLNHMPHPDIDYISIIRTTHGGLSGDHIVPGFSQNMNSVKALSGQSTVLYSPSPHLLVPQDGAIISAILKTETEHSNTVHAANP